MNLDKYLFFPHQVMTEILPGHVIGESVGIFKSLFFTEIIMKTNKNVLNTGIASGLCTSVHFLVSFLVTKNFQLVTVTLGIYWAFWLFGLSMVFGTAFVYFIVPETRMKTSEEIQLFFGPRLSLLVPNILRSTSPSATTYKTLK
jgi:hypothetical protein